MTIAGQDTIPSIFLSSSFNLEDSSTFYQVFTHINSSGIDFKNAILLQEKVKEIYV